MRILKYLKKHNAIVTFLASLFVIGLIFGLILGFKQDTIFKNDVLNSLSNLKELLLASKINNIFTHFLLFLILIATSFLVPLYFLNFIFLFFKGITIGFSLYIFSLVLGFKGFLAGLIYNIFTSCLFCLVYVYLIIRGINLGKNVIGLTLTHEKNYLINIKNTLLSIIIISGVCLLYDLLLYIFSNFIIDKLIYFF